LFFSGSASYTVSGQFSHEFLVLNVTITIHVY
jgi:hypothetical protein